MTFPLEVSIPGILSNQTSTQWPTYVKLNARMKASSKSKRAVPSRGSTAKIANASGTARSVLRVSCFTLIDGQPVDDGTTPDAGIAPPEHPVPFVREVEELRLDSHAFRRSKGLIPFR